MANSINTNSGALVALQNLNATSRDLNTTQNRINTGLKVNSAKDSGAIWAIAQSQRAEMGSLNSVKTSLQRGQSTIDVAMSAGEGVSDLLIQMKELALQASDSTLTTKARASLNEDFVAKRDQITSMVANATFDGTNLINAKPTTAQSGTYTTAKGTFDGLATTFATATATYATAQATYDAAKVTYEASAKDGAANTAFATATTNFGTATTAQTTATGTYKTGLTTFKAAEKAYNTTAAGEGGFKALANASGTSTLGVAQQNLSLGGAMVEVSSNDNLLDYVGEAGGSRAKELIASIDNSIQNVSTSLAKLGTASKSFDSTLTFTGKLQDSLESGIGNLVDADLAKESARLTALQTKQQLGVQALSIANQSSSVLLSLFR